MIRFFCDICGKDITNDKQAERLKGRSGRLMFEVITSIDGCWNGGHVCHDCIRAAIANPDVAPVFVGNGDDGGEG